MPILGREHGEDPEMDRKEAKRNDAAPAESFREEDNESVGQSTTGRRLSSKKRLPASPLLTVINNDQRAKTCQLITSVLGAKGRRTKGT